MFVLLLALTLVARSLALTLCHNHPGYRTVLTQGIYRPDILRSGQQRLYCFKATGERDAPNLASLYIKLATCKGTVSVRLFDPTGREIFMKGRDCDSGRMRDDIRYDTSKTSHGVRWAGSTTYAVPEEHSIWTYHNTSAMIGIYTIIVKAERTPCGEANYQILGSTKKYRQPPVLPEDTCILHEDRFTSRTQVGLSWSPAELPSDNPFQTIKYCVYMIPTHAHSHKCSYHGSRCSVALLRGPDTVEMCFVAGRRSRILRIVRNLKPGTEYHVDVIAWTYDRARRIYDLSMAYSQSEYITTKS